MKSLQVHDRFPQIDPAGLKDLQLKDTVSTCLIQDKENQTPEHMRKYRKIDMIQVGKTTLHFGNYNDVQNMDKNMCHGVKTQQSEMVESLIKNQNDQGFMKFIQSNLERNYKSEIEKPHGRSYQRNYVFPEVVHEETFLFGVKTRESKLKRQKVRGSSARNRRNVPEIQVALPKNAQFL